MAVDVISERETEVSQGANVFQEQIPAVGDRPAGARTPRDATVLRSPSGSDFSFLRSPAPAQGSVTAPEGDPSLLSSTPRAAGNVRGGVFPLEPGGSSGAPEELPTPLDGASPQRSDGVGPAPEEAAELLTVRHAFEERSTSKTASAAQEEPLAPLRERQPRERREGSEGESRKSFSPFSGDSAALAAGSAAPARSTFGDVLAAQSLSSRGDSAILEGAELLLRAAVRAESQTARMIIDPPALGPMEVSVTLAGDGLSASFRVESETVRQLLLQNADALRESLSRAGIQVAGFSVSVDVGQGGGRFAEPRPETRRRARDSRDEDEGDEGHAPVTRLDAEAGVLHWVG